MRLRFVTTALLMCAAANAQWVTPPTTAYTTLDTFMKALASAQAVTVDPTSTCTPGKDFAVNTVSGYLFYCKTAPSTWQKLPITAGDIGLSNVNNTSDANKPVSIAMQAALDLKQSIIVSHTLPTAGAAVKGQTYLWDQAVSANTCPGSGGSGSAGGSNLTFCVTPDNTSWYVPVLADSTGKITFAPGTVFEAQGATESVCSTPPSGAQTICFLTNGHLARVSPDGVTHDIEALVNGLADPGSNGIVYRSALGVTRPMTAADLPLPTTSTVGAVKSLVCTGSNKVSAINTDGSITCSAESGGLADPGGNGLVYRSSLGVTRPAVLGTDFYGPGGTIAPADIPLPAPTTIGGVKSYSCSGTDKISSINTDGTVNCSADVGPTPGVGRKTLTFTFSAAIPDGGCSADVNATWTGITTADTVIFGAPASFPVQFFGRVTANDTVTIRGCNLTGASLNPGSQTFNLTLAVYNLSGTGVIDFSTIQDGGCSASNFTLTGVAAGDPVAPKWPASMEAGLSGSGMIATATDTIAVTLCNFSGGPLDPASKTFGASIAK